jgi:hypothetical protein
LFLIGSISRFVGFFAMNPLISTAEGADVYFYGLYDRIGKSVLIVAGVAANRA